MYILYMDESGQHQSDIFTLAGIAVYERQTYWLSEEIDRLQQSVFPDLTEVLEFHASTIRSGINSPWDQIKPHDRYKILDDLCRIIVESRSVLFGVVVEKKWAQVRGEDVYQFALESLISRFDDFLTRRFRIEGERQRGLVVIASSEYQKVLEALALKVRRQGTRWGELHNIAEVPLFTKATNSRMLQAADFCANAINARYETGHTRHFDLLVPKFDNENGVMHGLSHFSSSYQNCFCPPCLTRRLRAPLPSPADIPPVPTDE